MPSLSTITFDMPPEKIALFKAIVESYDNLVTLRTENRQTHRLCIYFDADARDEVLGLFNQLIDPFAITRVEATRVTVAS